MNTTMISKAKNLNQFEIAAFYDWQSMYLITFENRHFD